MFIIWQSGQDVVNAGQADDQRCRNCDLDASHSIVVRYSYTNFYFILGIVSGREYFLVCDECDAAIQLQSAEAKAICPHVPIPFMRRFGCLMAIAAIALFALFANLFSQ